MDLNQKQRIKRLSIAARYHRRQFHRYNISVQWTISHHTYVHIMNIIDIVIIITMLILSLSCHYNDQLYHYYYY